jgi:hypothetical protein
MDSSSNNMVDISRSFFNKLGALGVLGTVLTLSACQGGGDVEGSVDVIDHRSEQLASGDLEAINGTYGAGCTNRSGAWSVGVALGAELDNPELSVILNDDSCVLTLTELVTATETLAADPPIALGTAYKGSPSAFDDPVEFYGNARLGSVSFADDFVLTVLYSDDPSLAVDDSTAQFEVVASSASDSSILPPDYAIDLSGLDLIVDSDQVVVSATGDIALTAGVVTGQRYVVVEASGLDTFAELDAAYIAGTDAALTATLPAADFTLVGEDLSTPKLRTLIIANTENNVAAYQAFEITFHPAVVI